MEQEFRIEGGELKSASELPRPPISERKLKANRANALRSTGPKTERGKNNSRYNAARHGILGRSLLLQSGAERAEFNGLVRDLNEELQPAGRLQELLVEEIIGAFAERYSISLETVSAANEDVFFPLPRPLRNGAAAG